MAVFIPEAEQARRLPYGRVSLPSLVNKQRSDRGVALLGFANPALYRIGESTRYTSDFHDLVTGNNLYYPAVTGYDDATGWGSFNGANLLTDLVKGGLGAPAGVVASAYAYFNGNPDWTFWLNWNSVSGATKYYVYRSATPGGEGQIIYGTVGTDYTIPRFTDIIGADGQTYYYKVTAVDANGESPRSVEVSATAK